MKWIKCFAGCALATGLLTAGTTVASAQDWRYQQQFQDRQDYRTGYNNAYNRTYGNSNSYDRIEELEQHIAGDHAKLNEAIRCGNDSEAARQAADLARDQRELHELQGAQNVRYSNGPVNNRRWSFRFGWR